jgi:integrase
MAKIKIKYVDHFTDRHGSVRYYFRRGGKRIGPLPGAVGSAEFMAAYQAYLSGNKNTIPVVTYSSSEGSFGRLISEYYASREFRDLKTSSRKTYKYVLEPLIHLHGNKTAQLSHKQATRLIHDIGEHKPGMANLSKSVLQKVFKFAVRTGACDTNPFMGIDRFKGGSHHSWTEGELLQFEKRWPLGTRQRLAFALLLHTGQRVGDVAKMRRQDIVNGEIHLIQEKTGSELYLPIVPELELAMKACQTKGMSLIGTEHGTPYSRGGLSTFMRDAINAADLPAKCNSHGLRKAKMRRLAEDGATVKEIAAWSGHLSLKEVERYTKAADQRLLAKSAMQKTRQK